MLYNILKDKRYTQSLEWCGHPKVRYVARFCGDWISDHETQEEALKSCQEAYNKRMSILEYV